MFEEEAVKTEGLTINDHWRDETESEIGGYYLDDIPYDSAETFIAVGLMNFCGCGDHESMLKHVRDILQEIKNHVDSKFTVGFSDYSGAKYLAWYVIDKLEWTEHGGAVPGWLTDLGKDILHDLNVMYS